MKRPEVEFDGLLNLNKPVGITSAKALYRVRSLTGIRKSGHAGTLDPGACGVLLICMGRATKRVESLMNLPKVYRAAARLDVTSASFDSDCALEAVEIPRVPTEEQVLHTASAVQRETLQIPPAISALKIGGQPAYRLARRQVPFQLQPRPVSIQSITVQRYRWPVLEFEVACGRGTYVRGIIRDIGKLLGTGGCLTSLERLAVGPFTVGSAATFEDLERGLFESRRSGLNELERLLREYGIERA